MAPLKRGLTTSLQANLSSKLRAPAASSSPFPQTAGEMNALIGFTPTAMWDFNGYTDVTVPDLVGSVDLVSKGSGTTNFDVATNASVTGVAGTEGAGEGVTGVFSANDTDLDKSSGSLFFLAYIKLIDSTSNRLVFGKAESSALGDRFSCWMSVTDGWAAFNWRESTGGSTQTSYFNGMSNDSDYVIMVGVDDAAASNETGGCFTGSGGHNAGAWVAADATNLAGTLVTGTKFGVCGTPTGTYNTSTNDGSDTVVSFLAVFTGSGADGMYASRSTICDNLWNAVNP